MAHYWKNNFSRWKERGLLCPCEALFKAVRRFQRGAAIRSLPCLRRRWYEWSRRLHGPLKGPIKRPMNGGAALAPHHNDSPKRLRYAPLHLFRGRGTSIKNHCCQGGVIIGICHIISSIVNLKKVQSIEWRVCMGSWMTLSMVHIVYTRPEFWVYIRHYFSLVFALLNIWDKPS